MFENLLNNIGIIKDTFSGVLGIGKQEQPSVDKLKGIEVIGIPKNEAKANPNFRKEPIPEDWKFTIGTQAHLTKNDPKFMTALFQTENPWWDAGRVREGGTDTGLGQHTKATQQDMRKMFNKEYDAKNPYQNIEMTAKWLNHIKNQIGTDNPKDVALAYHYGIGAYKKKDPKVLNDTDKYWEKVSSNFGR